MAEFSVFGGCGGCIFLTKPKSVFKPVVFQYFSNLVFVFQLFILGGNLAIYLCYYTFMKAALEYKDYALEKRPDSNPCETNNPSTTINSYELCYKNPRGKRSIVTKKNIFCCSETNVFQFCSSV